MTGLSSMLGNTTRTPSAVRPWPRPDPTLNSTFTLSGRRPLTCATRFRRRLRATPRQTLNREFVRSLQIRYDVVKKVNPRPHHWVNSHMEEILITTSSTVMSRHVQPLDKRVHCTNTVKKIRCWSAKSDSTEPSTLHENQRLISTAFQSIVRSGEEEKKTQTDYMTK